LQTNLGTKMLFSLNLLKTPIKYLILYEKWTKWFNFYLNYIGFFPRKLLKFLYTTDFFCLLLQSQLCSQDFRWHWQILKITDFNKGCNNNKNVTIMHLLKFLWFLLKNILGDFLKLEKKNRVVGESRFLKISIQLISHNESLFHCLLHYSWLETVLFSHESRKRKVQEK
jgi:hypothetical protein